MGEKENKLDISEAMDVIGYAQTVVQHLADARADDGQISKSEIFMTFIQTAPAAVQAIVGADKIDDELKDLTEDEKTKLLLASFQVVKTLSGIWGGDLAKAHKESLASEDSAKA